MTAPPPRPVIGILHPGAMGAAVGAALKPVAGAVIWAAAGRSITTSRRAETADLIGVPDVAAVARRADVIVSVCPPEAARDVAQQVADALRGTGRTPVYVDANAVAPATVTAIADVLAPAPVVDGAIIGPPAWERGDTVLWLAGERAPQIAELFAESPFVARVLEGGIGAASGLKACFALQSKALPAVWLTLAAAARAYGVEDALRGELARDGIDLDERAGAITARATGKAWRWIGEMEEAGDAFAALGLPDGFSRAAAAAYRALAAEDPTDRANIWNLRGPGAG
jgi:3-hydroxyisobutyrate dehydrogenase-like beta-hydroxyacid dehydrogenase